MNNTKLDKDYLPGEENVPHNIFLHTSEQNYCWEIETETTFQDRRVYHITFVIEAKLTKVLLRNQYKKTPLRREECSVGSDLCSAFATQPDWATVDKRRL